MRRSFSLLGGVLQLTLGVLLLRVVWQLPGGARVRDGFDRAEEVTRNMARQAELAREHLHALRQSDVSRLSRELQQQVETVTTALRQQQIDYPTLEALRDGLRETGRGLEDSAQAFDPERLARLGDGLCATADFLELKAIPAALRAADQLEKATGPLGEDTRRLAELLRLTPLDLEPARQMRDALGGFGEGLETAGKSLPNEQQLQTISEAFQGLSQTLTMVADRAEKLGQYSYPAPAVEGFRPVMHQKRFWPEGEEIAENLRKTAKGVAEARKLMEGASTLIPRTAETLKESRKILEATRLVLDRTLSQRAKIEPLLKELPERTANLAEELPRVGTNLAQLLRETRSLKDVATSLRQGQKALLSVSEHWPTLRRTIRHSAEVLRATSVQLDQALRNREVIEQARQQSVLLGESLTRTLPAALGDFETRLRQQDLALADLDRNLGSLGDTIPTYAELVNSILEPVRWLLLVLALGLGVNGGRQLLATRLTAIP